MAACTSYSLNLYSARASEVYRGGVDGDPSPKLLISFNYSYQLRLPAHQGVAILLDEIAVPERRWSFRFPMCSAASSATADFVNGALSSVVGPGDGSKEDEAALAEIRKRIVAFSVEAERKHGARDFVVAAAVGVTRKEEVAHEEVAAFVAAQSNAGAPGDPIVN